MSNDDIEKKQIKAACEKSSAKPVEKSLDSTRNLLVFLLVIDGETGRILDVVRKPGFSNDNVTGYEHSKSSVKNDVNHCGIKQCGFRQL